MGNDNVMKEFLKVMGEVAEFGRDVMLGMVHAKGSETVVIPMTSELCEECGPVEEDRPYQVDKKCRQCGEKRVLKFW